MTAALATHPREVGVELLTVPAVFLLDDEDRALDVARLMAATRTEDDRLLDLADTLGVAHYPQTTYGEQ